MRGDTQGGEGFNSPLLEGCPTGGVVFFGLCADELCSTFDAAIRCNLFLFCHPELVEGQKNKKRIFTAIRQPLGGRIFFQLLLWSRTQGGLYFF